MTTLREIVEQYDFPEDVHRLASAIESWAYGQERECGVCGGTGGGQAVTRPVWVDCSECDGTGSIREPGLVERVHERLSPDLTPPSGWTFDAVLAALREELGVE